MYLPTGSNATGAGSMFVGGLTLPDQTKRPNTNNYPSGQQSANNISPPINLPSASPSSLSSLSSLSSTTLSTSNPVSKRTREPDHPYPAQGI